MNRGNIISLRNACIYHVKDTFRDPRRKSMKDKRDLVLSDVDLDVSGGEFVYLIGRVGSGKSSLLKTLYAELPLCEGDGNVVGFDLRSIKRKEVPYLRRSIGMVFQDYQLLTDRDVFGNLYFVMRATGWKDNRVIRNRITDVLEMVNLLHKEHKMPFQLSGGEQQRLSIARALLNNPRVLLADEPTGNLDPAAADEVMELLKSIAEGGTAVIMSTHNINIIQQYPSRTIRFNNGRLEEIDIRSILGI